MVETYPLLKHFYEDKRMIDAVKNLKLEIGSDNRNRFWLNPFGTKTGRNNPSTNGAIFGLPHTMRSFMRPRWAWRLRKPILEPRRLVLRRFKRDPALIADYLSGDPYRRFAAAALGVQSPTKQERQIYKAQCSAEFMASALPRSLAIWGYPARRRSASSIR